jgi:hypothetical protein
LNLKKFKDPLHILEARKRRKRKERRKGGKEERGKKRKEEGEASGGRGKKVKDPSQRSRPGPMGSWKIFCASRRLTDLDLQRNVRRNQQNCENKKINK